MTSKDYIKSYFKERAISFPDFYTRRPLLPIEACIVDQIPAGSNVLDLCCGGGEIALAVAKRGSTVTGVDNVPEMTALCETLFADEGYNGTFVTADATSLPFLYHTFSHVVCAGSSLNSMDNQDARLTILEATRVTKRGGIVYFAILNPSGMRNLLAVARGVIQRAPKWGFYYRSSYGIDADGKEIPRGLSFLVPWHRLRVYLSEARLEYEPMRWTVGSAADHLLLICRKG